MGASDVTSLLSRKLGRLLRVIAAGKKGWHQRVWSLPLACISAWLLTLAFPTSNVVWLAPFACVGLFLAWYACTPKRAFLVGFASGLVYFDMMFAWFGETVGRLLGSFAFITALGPAALEALAFAFAAVIAALAFDRIPRGVAPLAAAASFTLFEWVRSVGPFGVPFAQIGVSQVDGWLAPLAAIGGVSLVTFAVALVGAYIAAAVLDRSTAASTLLALAAVAISTAFAYLAWPARLTPKATIPVAAIQGNIAQEVKWHPQTMEASISQYIDLTQQIAPYRPRLVLWPETVITTELGDDAALSAEGALAARALRQRFANVARQLHTTLLVGSLQQSADGLHNAMFVFSPSGSLQTIYRKRQLVPFAETLPAPQLLGSLPFANLVGRQRPGVDPLVFHRDGLAVAPLICWESAFGDLAYDQLARGASLFVIPTDDGWFGHTAGPYQHAQFAQMRAIESGRWVLRAGATGISGIIAPNGQWTLSTILNRTAIVTGNVGQSAPTLFSRIGPTPFAAMYAGIIIGVFAFAYVRGRKAPGNRSAATSQNGPV